MKTFENILFQQEEGVVTIVINRPDKLNALNFKTLEELNQAFDIICQKEDIKGVLLVGSGEKSFVAGADISEFTTLDKDNGVQIAKNGQDLFAKIENCPKPVVGLINGFALGGGCELSLACHIRLATPNAKFALPEVTLGIIPGYGGTQRLTMLVGKGRALELIMTGEMIDANEAYRIGLVNKVLDDHNALAQAGKLLLSKILSRAPIAIGQAIKAVNAVYDEKVDGYAVEAQCFANAAATNDFKEGTDAFLNKRKANFKGN